MGVNEVRVTLDDPLGGGGANLLAAAQAELGLSLLNAAVFSIDMREIETSLQWGDQTRAAQILRCPPHRLPLNTAALEDFIDVEGRLERRKKIQGLTWNGAHYAIQYSLTRFDGEPVWFEERGKRVAGNGNLPTLVHGVLLDITRSKRAEIRAAYHAMHDELTGIWNKGRFIEALDYEMKTLDYREAQGQIIGLRVTCLPDISRHFGPDSADYVLKAIAARLKSETQMPASVARVDESSFGLLLPICSQEKAEEIAAIYKKWLETTTHNSPYGDLNVTCTTATVPLAKPTRMGAEIVEQLREMLTDIRSAAVASEPVPEDDKRRTAEPEVIGPDKILDVLNNDRLSLAFQPIVRAASLELSHYEGLLRTLDDDGELVTAAPIVVAAEEYGYIHLLDQRALRLGVDTLLKNSGLNLSLNISPGTLKHEFATQAYLKVLEELGESAGRITLELTETMAVEDPIVVGRFVAAIQAMGCKFAIDDFGSGHTSFRNLMAIEADVIKIDGLLVQGVAETKQQQMLVRMIIDLAQTFELETVAEMVNSEADADFLRRQGIDYFQGYMFGRPEPLPNYSKGPNSNSE